MLLRFLFVCLVSLYTGYTVFAATPSGWVVSPRSEVSARELADVYLASLRILDAQEAALKTSFQPSFANPYFASAWASENSCLLAGWEGEVSSTGRCLPKQNGFEAAKGKCGPAEGQTQQIPCNPAIFGAELGCVKLEKSNSHWTRACTEALIRKAGDQSGDVSLSSHSAELEAYLAAHPELAKNAASAASKVCSQVAARKSDQGDCALLEKFLHAKASHPRATTDSKNCTDSASVLGKDAAACVSNAQSAISASESEKKWADCHDQNCRTQLLKAEIKLGLKETLGRLAAVHDKTGSEFAYPLAGGKCELAVGYEMLQPYDEKAGSMKGSKMKPVKTLVLKIQNDLHRHAFVDRGNELRKNLTTFIDGSDGDDSFHGTVLESARESCFEGR